MSQYLMHTNWCYSSIYLKTQTFYNGNTFSTGVFFIYVCYCYYTYFHAYMNLNFKHAFLGTHLSCLGCLSRTELGFVSFGSKVR